MNLVLYVALAMLAAVGLVQMIAWLICRARGPERRPAFQVIRLETDPAKLDEQLRYELLLMHWSTHYRPEIVVLVDDGLGEEERALCRRMLCDFQTAILCAPDELADLIRLRAEDPEE